jgi:hypothetical protein
MKKVYGGMDVRQVNIRRIHARRAASELTKFHGEAGHFRPDGCHFTRAAGSQGFPTAAGRKRDREGVRGAERPVSPRIN